MKTWHILALVVAGAASAACSPADLLANQGQQLKNTDYLQGAINKQQQNSAKNDKQQAEIDRHVKAGDAHVDLYEYGDAINEYKEAYRLSTDATLLPKLGNAERLTGDCVAAADFYQQYLTKLPSAADNATVSGKLAEAKRCQTASGSNLDAVRKHYNDGATHYRLEEYPAAITDFKEAFRLSNDAIYLFNIAQSYRLAKDCTEAGNYYKKYLAASPNADDKDKVQARVDEMAACAH